jgi:serine/threonine-protein kinase
LRHPPPEALLTDALQQQLAAALGGGFEITRELGGGGMSRVFLARDTALGRQVVLKVLPPGLGPEVNLDRFRREIQLAAGLNHPHIVPLLSASQTSLPDGSPVVYFVMPYIEGESLRARIGREGELPLAECLRILREVVDALSYAHARGIVHRDIKPDNVLLANRHALVTDFGVAKALTDSASPGGSLTSLGMAVGTPAYMAPEQAAADPHVDHRADIYAVGVLAYEMLTGRPPFTGSTPQAVIAAQVTQTADPVTRYRPSAPPALVELVAHCLEKHAADRPQSAEEVLHALETVATPSGGITPVAGIAPTTVRPAATSAPTAAPGARRPPMKWVAIGAAAVVVLALAGGAVARRGGSKGIAFDENTVAVAPFDVLAPGLALWREGLVDVLSRTLDGAGPLRTVAPSTVIQRWHGRADAVSAADLGRATGAKLVVYGTLQGVGDSARVDATLLDASTGRSIGEVTVREAQSHLDRLGDSLAVQLLRQAGRVTAIGVVRGSAVGARSLPALKAFLEGEQEFRRAQWDSSRTSFERALALDSTLVPAIRRLSETYGWQGSISDSMFLALGLRAGALNHGLSPRESLLVTTDSLIAAVASSATIGGAALRPRLLETTRNALNRYPDDAEVQYAWADARLHLGDWPSQTWQQLYDGFARVEALDSAYAPGFDHGPQLALLVGRPDAARHFARRLLSLHPSRDFADIAELTLLALDSTAPPDSFRALMARAAPTAVAQAAVTLSGYGDPGEAAVQLAREFHRRSPHENPGFFSRFLAARGHLREAYAMAGDEPRWVPGVVAALVIDGMPMPDTVPAMFQRSLSGPFTLARGPAGALAVPIWAANGDTVSILRLGKIFDSLGRQPGASGNITAAPPVLRAYLALARRDSAGALKQLAALPDSLYGNIGSIRFTYANLLAAAHRDAEALAVLDHPYDETPVAMDVLRFVQRGRVAERLGKRETAVESYRRVVQMWRKPDPELLPYVTEAKTALSRLSAER